MSTFHKTFLLFAIIFSIAIQANSQPAITATFDAIKIDSSLYELKLKVAVPASWHVYGLNRSGGTNTARI